MKVKTKAAGTVDVDDSQIIDFPQGLFGFEEYHGFAVIESEYRPFWWIQSLDESTLAFAAIDPFVIVPDYEIEIDDATLSSIGVSSPCDVVVFSIVTIPDDGRPVTANLQGPVVINKKNRKALQVILGDSKWSIKHNIIDSSSSGASKGTRLC